MDATPLQRSEPVEIGREAGERRIIHRIARHEASKDASVRRASCLKRTFQAGGIIGRAGGGRAEEVASPDRRGRALAAARAIASMAGTAWKPRRRERSAAAHRNRRRCLPHAVVEAPAGIRSAAAGSRSRP